MMISIVQRTNDITSFLVLNRSWNKAFNHFMEKRKLTELASLKRRAIHVRAAAPQLASNDDGYERC